MSYIFEKHAIYWVLTTVLMLAMLVNDVPTCANGNGSPRMKLVIRFNAFYHKSLSTHRNSEGSDTEQRSKEGNLPPAVTNGCGVGPRIASSTVATSTTATTTSASASVSAAAAAVASHLSQAWVNLLLGLN